MKILLLALGFPVWLSLYIAFLAILISLVASVWAIFGSFVGVFLGSLVLALKYFIGGSLATGGMMLGIALAALGFAIITFNAARSLTKGSLGLSKDVTLGIISAFRNV